MWSTWADNCGAAEEEPSTLGEVPVSGLEDYPPVESVMKIYTPVAIIASQISILANFC
jgi:hypothetical protein